MDRFAQRRAALEDLLDLAQKAHGWSRRGLARALGRDASKLVPGSGVPKLDLVVRLAGILGWTVGDIVGHLRLGAEWEEPVGGRAAPRAETSFDSVDDEARAAHRGGRYADLVHRAGRAYAMAQTPHQRAVACNREAGGWDGLGCHARALAAARRGLREHPVAPDLRRMLQANLANAHFGLRAWAEARCVSGHLLAWYAERPPRSLTDRVAHAFAHFVAGRTRHELAVADAAHVRTHAAVAAGALQRAATLCQRLASERGDHSYSGIANTCRGALLEIDVMLERRRPTDAVRAIARGLDDVVDCAAWRSGDWLESYGWWCVHGCGLVRRFLDRGRMAHHYLAVFTNKADEIAERLDNWALRERVVRIEHDPAAGPRLLDAEDVRKIAGTMGRFPDFRSDGWRLLAASGVGALPGAGAAAAEDDPAHAARGGSGGESDRARAVAGWASRLRSPRAASRWIG